MAMFNEFRNSSEMRTGKMLPKANDMIIIGHIIILGLAPGG